MLITFVKKSVLLFALGFMTALLSAAPAYAADDDTDEDPYFILMGEVDKAIADGNYEEAAARLVDAMAVEPGNPGNVMLLSNLGMVYSYMDKDSLALVALDEASKRAPRMVTVINNRARIYLKLKRDDEALREFSHALEIDSVNLDARYYRGFMSLYKGNLTGAEADFDVLKRKVPNSYITAVALSSLYSMTGRDRQAVPYFEKLIELDPNPEYYAGLAGCYLALENLSEASAVINEGLKRYSRDPELYYYCARLNHDRFRLDDARADAKKAIEYGASPAKVNAIFEKKRK